MGNRNGKSTVLDSILKDTDAKVLVITRQPSLDVFLESKRKNMLNIKLRIYKNRGYFNWKIQCRSGFGLGKFSSRADTVLQEPQHGHRSKWHLIRRRRQFVIECLLGKNAPASGTVYFKDITVEELSSQTLEPKVSIDLEAQKEPISPYIYGQFIEHMGKSLYGGLWAEVTDRKFCHKPITLNFALGSFSNSTAITLDPKMASQNRHCLFSIG